MFPLSFLILIISLLSFFLSQSCQSFVNLLIFLKNQLLVSWIFSIVFLFSTLFISPLIFIIYFALVQFVLLFLLPEGERQVVNLRFFPFFFLIYFLFHIGVNFFLFLFLFFKLFIFLFLFMAVLGLCFCERAFSSRGKWGPLFIVVRGPLTIAVSPVAQYRLQMRRLSNCGSQAQLLHGMWDLPGPGVKPVSPALAGRFSTTASPGKPSLPF